MSGGGGYSYFSCGCVKFVRDSGFGKDGNFIPSPNAAENHQYHNAMALVNNDAAIVFEEKDLTANKLIDAVNDLLNDREKISPNCFNAKKWQNLMPRKKFVMRYWNELI